MSDLADMSPTEGFAMVSAEIQTLAESIGRALAEVDSLRLALSKANGELQFSRMRSDHFENEYTKKVEEINFERKRASELVDALDAKADALLDAIIERDEQIEALVGAIDRSEREIRRLRSLPTAIPRHVVLGEPAPLGG